MYEEKPKGSKHLIIVSIKFNSPYLLTQLDCLTSLISSYMSKFTKSAHQPEVTVCSRKRRMSPYIGQSTCLEQSDMALGPCSKDYSGISHKAE